MVSRKHRLGQFLESLGILPDGKIDRHETITYYEIEDRGVYKSELEVLCKKFDIDSHGTKDELRTRIREDLIPHKINKSGDSRFSSWELFRLTRCVNHAKYLEAEDIGWLEDIAEISEVEIDGDIHTVSSVEEKRVIPEDWNESYQSYQILYLEGGSRLILLYHFDRNKDMRYKHGVIVEKQVGFGPYEQWSRGDYIKEVDFYRPMSVL